MHRPRSGRLLNVILLVVLLAIGGGAYAVVAHGRSNGTGASSLATATVARGTVRATVSASATVEAPQELGLNFATAGTLTGIDVKVGQQVRAGQVVAHIDDATSRQSLEQASATLSSAEATLAKAEQGETGADAKVATAQIASARAQVRSARSALSHERDIAAANAAQYRQQVDAAQSTLNAAVQQQTNDQVQLAADQGAEGQDCSVDPTSAACQADTAAVNDDQSRLAQDASAISQDQNGVASAEASKRVGLARDRQTVAQDVSQVSAAMKSLDSTIASSKANAVTDPTVIAQDRASVTSAQLQVDQADEALAGTVLRVPIAGTVVSVSGTVGGVVSAGGNTVSTPESAGSSSSATDSSATGVVVISDIHHLELRADFSETDAAKLKVGQEATATLDAIADVTMHGTVVAIDPTSTVVNNVVDYGVTIHLRTQPRGLTQGQTANVQVATGRVKDALYVPSAAVETAGGQDTVVLLVNGVQRTTVVRVGLQGDQTTQILSGVSAGDRVVIPSGTGANGFPSGGFPGGGFGVSFRSGGGSGP